ncbi:MAG: GNAT family N-acetyltransferase [Chthoniobacterales bacterium]
MQSERIRLLAHTPDHLRALMDGGDAYERQFEISVASGVREFLTGPEVSESFLARLREAVSADPWRDGFGVVQLANQRLIGLCSFGGPPDAEGGVEISYGVAPEFEGQGYATEAARLLMAHAFASGRVRRVWAHTLPEDNASTRILEKCGFKYCGESIDPIDGAIWRWEKRSATGDDE